MQNSLQAMQTKVDETNALLVKEREAARKAIEEAPPVIKETPVIVEDTKKVESLTAEVESFKVMWFDPNYFYLFSSAFGHRYLCKVF